MKLNNLTNKLLTIFTLGIFLTGCAKVPSSYNDDLIYIDGYVLSKETGQPYSGDYVRFYDNGQKEMGGIITNGIRDGLWTYWNYKGQKIGEGSWIDNDKDGKWKWWYPLQTAKTIVQAAGRSVRSNDDHAVTYILDSDWEYFYRRNKIFFPKGFRDTIQ